jgi:alkaline phosphatase D
MRSIAIGVVFATACIATDDPEGGGPGGGGKADDPSSRPLRIAQFNIRELTTAKLLDPAHRQVNAAADVIARFDAEILSINEIQYDLADVPIAGLPGAPAAQPGAISFDGDPAGNAARLAKRVAAVDPELDYAHAIMFLGNSGFAYTGATGGHAELEMRGFGEFNGRYNSALLSKHPIRTGDVRVIHDYPWRDVPGNSIAELEATLGIAVPDDFPIFEKALHVVPVEIETGAVVYFVLAHPVSSGFSALNPYRNRDELHAIALYLSGELPGVEPLPPDAHFVVVGDLNSDPEDGDGGGGIRSLIEHPRIDAHFPEGRGGSEGMHPERNTFLSGCGRETGPIVANPATKLQLQLDYLLTSTTLGDPMASSIYWPHHVQQPAEYALTCYASDHRFVWMDLRRPH